MNFLSKICALLLIAWSSQLIAQSEITSIEFEGLKVTNTKVVINELNVSVGSIVNINTLDSVLSLECSQLYNLRLFHWVKSRYKVNEKKNTVDVVFTFQERWYLWPIPIFSLADRNFNSWLQKGNLKRLDYGLHIVHYNFRGKNEHLKSNIQEGYNKKYEVFYTIPYINKNQNLGIEVATSYSRSHYVDFNVEDNKLLTKEFNFYPLQKYYLRGSIFYRKSVLNQIYFRSEFKSLSISDSLTNLNANYIGVSGNVKFVTFQLEYLLNKRNNFSYPEKGYFVSADITQRVGLENVNLRLLQSSLNVAKYTQLSKNLFITNSLSVKNRISSAGNYFIDQQALGYANYIRGYELYVMNGSDFALIKNDFKIKLVKNKMIKFKFVKSSKFNAVPVSVYLASHMDLGYVNNPVESISNNLVNDWQYGYGIGVHLVTYYDRVLVLEYSMNKMNEKGFFISAKFPI